jgi:DNA-binding NarL/FixJ family response regulator
VLTTDADERNAGEALTLGTATLIASDAAGDAISELLRAEGLRTTTFGLAEKIPDRGEQDDSAVAVLWTRDASSSLARRVAALAKRFEPAPVILVCENIERWGIRAALAGGAAGVVLYEELGSAFSPCLQAVLAGQACVPRAHQQQIEPPPLSAREKQILGLVVMGYMNSQIAEQLFLAESTVKSHLSSAFGKLGVRSRHEAVNLIINPDGGLGLGILGLVGEEQPLDSQSATVL